MWIPYLVGHEGFSDFTNRGAFLNLLIFLEEIWGKHLIFHSLLSLENDFSFLYIESNYTIQRKHLTDIMSKLSNNNSQAKAKIMAYTAEQKPLFFTPNTQQFVGMMEENLVYFIS